MFSTYPKKYFFSYKVGQQNILFIYPYLFPNIFQTVEPTVTHQIHRE